MQYLQLNDLDRAAETLQPHSSLHQMSYPALELWLVLLQQKKYADLSSVAIAIERMSRRRRRMSIRRALIGLRGLRKPTGVAAGTGTRWRSSCQLTRILAPSICNA